MNLRKQIRNREIQREKTQTKRRKYKILKTNHTRKTLDNKRRNKENLLNYQTKLGRRSRSGLNGSNKMRNKQYKNYRTFRLTERIRTSISIERNKILDEKRRSGLRNHSKRTRTKIIVVDIHET